MGAQNEIQGHIPENLSLAFPKLVELHLSNNKLEGNIPSSIGDSKCLEALHLSNNHVSGKVDHLPESLIDLDLSNNQLKGELPSTQGSLLFQSLNLKGNKFSSGLQTMKFGPRLGFLILSNNSLEGPIPKYISNWPTLMHLDLSFIRLTGPLPKFTSPLLSSLKLKNNRLSGYVTNAFCNAPNSMKFLDLSYNDLKGHIPDAIVNMTQLKALILKGNQFHGQIPSHLCNLEHLSMLDLSSNNLQGSIPTCLGHIATMKQGIVPGYRAVTSADEIEWDKLMSPSSNPYPLSMHDPEVNFTTKNMDYSFNSDILNWMAAIDLSCNNLTGHIPHVLGNLSNILALNLSHNQLQGVIPSAFSKLNNLESLDLSYNQLNGKIPVEVTTLDSLEVFNVSYNNFSGRIPFQGHSITFDATSYKGNPFLCGPPLPNSCGTAGDQPPSTAGTSQTQDEDSDDLIDMEAFYVTFAASGVTMFLAVVVIMVINPHWLNAWFYLVKICMFSGYYFFEDNIRMIRRARRV